MALSSLLQAIPSFLAVAMALAAAQGQAPPHKACQPLPSLHRIPRLPFAEQRKDWCGPAALAAVLQYHGEKTTAAEIAKQIYLPGYRGALNLDLLLWARKRGFSAWGGAGSPDRIRQAVARDLPVICMVRRRGPLADRNHFVIIRGYDHPRGLWLVDDGSGKQKEARYADFDRAWQGCGRWMLVIEGKSRASPSEDQDAAS
jgi:ABC-type bacteriocin/lantibiotic exporter with double-glycine peptidase domain